MRFEQLLAIFVLALTLMSVLALAGFWTYLLYMAFALNLYTQVIILAGLLTLFKISKLFASEIYKTLKEGKSFDKEENEE
jgi:hypothetical protein